MKNMVQALRGMSDAYWEESELIAREVLRRRGLSAEEIEAKLEEARKIYRR